METVMCVDSRRTGGANVYRGERTRLKITVKIAAAALAAVLLAATAGTALAALAAPNFMPGFPMVAGTQLIMMWTPVPGAAKYQIFQNGKPIADVTAFQYLGAVPSEGSNTFNVAAVDASGAVGAMSKDFLYVVQKLEKPTGMVALPSEKRVVIRWDAVKTAVIYDVQRAEKKEGPFALVASTQDLFFTDTGLKPGLTYVYRVSAKNVAGVESPPSNTLEVKLETVAVAEEAGKAEAKKVLPIRTSLLWETSEMPEGADIVIFPDKTIAMSTAYPGASTIQFFDATGKPTVTVNPPKGMEKTVTFIGLCLSREGNLWAVSNTSPDLFLISRDGAILTHYPLAPLPDTQTPYRFFDVAEGPGGKLFLSEQINSLIFVVESGKITGKFAERGWKDGQVNSPMFETIVKDELFVGDGGNNRIVVFGLDGKFRRNFGGRGGAEAGTFMRLSGIASDEEGKVYAADRVTNNIQVFEPSGAFYGALSNEEGTGQAKTAPVGLFVRNKQMAVSVPLAAKIHLFNVLGPKAAAEPKK